MNKEEIDRILNVFENTGDFGKYYLGDYSNEDIAKFIRNILQENTNLKQALNEIYKIITECKMLMPHEFDWDEQGDNILQIIDKANIKGSE